jgi:hypothetical protein
MTERPICYQLNWSKLIIFINLSCCQSHEKFSHSSNLIRSIIKNSNYSLDFWRNFVDKNYLLASVCMSPNSLNCVRHKLDRKAWSVNKTKNFDKNKFGCHQKAISDNQINIYSLYTHCDDITHAISQFFIAPL